MNNPTIITIANQKGGVAKTTSVQNIADAVSRLTGKKVLVIDCDPQANLTFGVIGSLPVNAASISNLLDRDVYYLDIEGNHSYVSKTMMHELKGQENFSGVEFFQADFKDALIETTYLDIIPAPDPKTNKLTNTSVALTNMQIDRSRQLQRVIDSILAERAYDFVLIDTPATLEILTLNALCASSHVIIPVSCGAYSSAGLNLLDATLLDIEENMGRKIEILGVLATLYDSRLKIQEQILGTIKADYPTESFETIVPRNVKVEEAPTFKKSVLEHDIQSKGAIAYKAVAKEILNRLGM